MSVIHQGDALTVLRTLADDSVDAVITDPPYNSGGRSPADRTGQSAMGKYVSGGSAASRELDDFVGDSRDQRAYTVWLSIILAECLRVARVSSPLLVFTDWRQLAATSDALQAGGWTWRGIVPWHKPVSRPARGGFRRSCEYVLWATRGPVDGARNPVYLDGMFQASPPRGANRKHITAKPVELMQELVRVSVPGGIVLDPFAGSGTTGVAAVLQGRRFVGIEMSPNYADTARRRLAELDDHQEDACHSFRQPSPPPSIPSPNAPCDAGPLAAGSSSTSTPAADA